ncbi:MAG: SDR family oxidoreductase [Bdellovibrionota bacterium]
MLHFWYWWKILKRRNRPRTFKPVVLVTGCSSGIGLALAQELYNIEDYRVVITAREKSLPILAAAFKENERFIIRPLDVSFENDRKKLIQEIQESWGGVSILINNAGISYRSVIEHMTEKDEYNQMATNYFGAVGLIRLVIPYMRELGRGKIINVSSVSGMLAMPTMASYSASKHALEGMSEALWYEMKPLGINVSLIQPGFIHSNSFRNVYYTEQSKPEAGKDGPYCDYYGNMTPFIEKLMKKSPTDPKSIARTILKVIKTEDPPLWIAATFDATLFYYVRRWVPRRFLLPFLFYFLPNSKTWGQKYTHKRQG